MASFGDVSDIPTWERFSHFLDSYGGSEMHSRAAAMEAAQFAAQAEMLDEIHLMLRHLCAQGQNGTKTECMD